MRLETHPLVAQAQAALCRLADAPPAADAARAATAEIEQAWRRGLLSAGIGGELPHRTALVNFLYGEHILDPFARAIGSPAIRIRRGATTRFRARRADGTHEDLAAPVLPHDELASVGTRAAAASGALAARETALVQFDRSLPAVIRRRPAAWAVWMWPVFWILSWLARTRLAERRAVELSVIESRQQVVELERDRHELVARMRTARTRYVEAVGALASRPGSATGVRELELELAGGPLPEGIELLELTGPSRAEAAVDAVLVVAADGLYAPRHDPLHVGELAVAIRALPSILQDARALAIARRFHSKIEGTVATLERAIERKEAGFAARIADLEARRIRDPVAFTRAQLDRVSADIISHVHAVMEHVSSHLGSELALLQEDWIGAIAGTQTAEALKLKVAAIIESWDPATQRIGGEVRTLVLGGLAGTARDLYPDLVAPLVAHGLPEAHAGVLREAPVLPAIDLLPALSGTTASRLELPGWFSGLFRAFEARRTEVREKVHARLERLQELSAADLRDAQPRFHAVIRQVLGELLASALGHQQAWLEAALEAEHAAIARDSATLEPLAQIRTGVRAELGRLSELIVGLERHLPAVAIASTAAETARTSSPSL